jgi:hypothetical protein
MIGIGRASFFEAGIGISFSAGRRWGEVNFGRSKQAIKTGLYKTLIWGNNGVP